MKHQLIIIMLIVVNCHSATAQNKIMKNAPSKLKSIQNKEDSLAQAIFKSLKEKNSNNWILLYPTNDEYKNILQLLLAAKSEGLTQQKIDEMIEHRKLEAVTVYKAEFKTYLKEADSLGIKWNDAVFEKFNFEASNPQNLKLKYLNGDIWFKCQQNHFVIEGIEAVEIEVGYKLQAVKGIRQANDRLEH